MRAARRQGEMFRRMEVLVRPSGEARRTAEQIVVMLEEKARWLDGYPKVCGRDLLRSVIADINIGEHDTVTPARRLALRYAEALLAIVGQPWVRFGDAGHGDERFYCPGCDADMVWGEHQDRCLWVLAARALGIWP